MFDPPKFRLKLLPLLVALAIGAVACGGGGASPGTASSDAPAPTDAPAADPTPATTQTPDTAAPAPESNLPSVELVDVSTGATVNLASFAPSDRPLVLWFWAPH